MRNVIISGTLFSLRPMSIPPEQTFDSLYLDHHGWLSGWLYRKLGCSHQAADLAHDTFVRLLTRSDDAREDQLREPRAYLRVIAGGLVVDHFRRRSLEQAYLEALAALPEAVGISPEDREVLLEALQRIDAMLDRLPPKVRKVFLLSQLDGLSYPQIAGRMGLSVRTVKRYMQQGFCQCLAIML